MNPAQPSTADRTDSRPGIQLPAGREGFRVWEVAKLLGHSRKHIENLLAEGAFGTYLDAKHPKAKKSSVIITRQGLEKFLKERQR
jgi:hypothetical protein